MSAEYRIGSLADFALIPPDRIDACLLDFAAWLRLIPIQGRINDLTSKILDGQTTLVTDSFIWADDGIVGITEFIVECDGEEIGRLPVARA